MNTLLIFADQMHKFALHRLSPFMHTPNLDRLNGRGTMFTNAYSNNPVCTPFRGVLLSGQYSSVCGVSDNCLPLPTNVPMLADAFNAAGYETCFVGKWHLGGNGSGPIPRDIRGGFTRFFGYQCMNGFFRNVSFFDEQDREHHFEEHRESVCTRYAVAYMRAMHKTGRPFLQVVGYQAPHYPEQPSDAFAALYEGRPMPVPPDYMDTEPYTPTYSPPSPRPFDLCPDYRRYGGNMQEYMRLYCAMVSEIDAGVGRLMDTLDELGITEETNIVFTSDHGDMQGSRGLTNKCLPFERSCGIPMIIAAPGGAADAVEGVPISALDLYPTLLSLHGLPAQPHLQGRDISPLLFGKPIPPRPVFCENMNRFALERDAADKHPWKMVREERYKLVVTWDDQRPRYLFDMDADPYEQRNLVDALPETRDRLAALLAAQFPL